MKTLLTMILLIPTLLVAQITEKYTDHADGAKTFSEGGLSFSVTGSLEVDVLSGWGLDDDNFISNFASAVSGGGSVGSFTNAGSNFKVHELYLIPLNSSKLIEQYNNILVRGKLDGATQFTHTVLWNSINMGSSNNYYTYVDLSSYSSYTLDEVEFIIEPYGTNNIVYLMVDDFQFEADVSLPVELSHFSARGLGESVILMWTTESETDNLGFVLERSAGNSAWTRIASYQTNESLMGMGNTSSASEYFYTDSDVKAEATYTYRLSDVSTDGVVHCYQPLTITLESLPLKTEMDRAYPNPFNPQTYIAYHLAQDEDVTIEVFDSIGRQIKRLHTGSQSAGSYHVYWNGLDSAGLSVPSGVYLIRMRTGTVQKTQKVMLVR